MNDEFDNLNRYVPDFEQVLLQRLNASKNNVKNTDTGVVDPYQIMLKKKQTPTENNIPVRNPWPEKDVSQLQSYCEKMGIVGFNSGKMHPIAALAMLKSQFGDDFTGIPLEERVPSGYEKLGTPSSHTNPTPTNKKQIIHG